MRESEREPVKRRVGVRSERLFVLQGCEGLLQSAQTVDRENGLECKLVMFCVVELPLEEG